jgi:hypothetical protein
MRTLAIVALVAGLNGFSFWLGQNSIPPCPVQTRPLCTPRVGQWEGLQECRSKCFIQNRMEKVK